MDSASAGFNARGTHITLEKEYPGETETGEMVIMMGLFARIAQAAGTRWIFSSPQGSSRHTSNRSAKARGHIVAWDRFVQAAGHGQ